MGKLKDLSLKVVGVTFPNPNGSSRQDAIMLTRLNSPVVLKREPNNEYDPNAIAVFVGILKAVELREEIEINVYLEQVGFLAGEDAKNIAVLMDSGVQFDAKVEQIGIHKGKNYLKILVDEV